MKKGIAALAALGITASVLFFAAIAFGPKVGLNLGQLSQRQQNQESEAAVADLDGDGFGDALEQYLGTDPARRCANASELVQGKPNPAWPADLTGDNKLAINDQNSFTAPVNRFNTKQGDANFDKRWDLNKNNRIDIGDINALNPGVNSSTAKPPMFQAQSAFGRSCTESLPQAPPDIACDKEWQTIKDLGQFSSNSIINYKDQYLLLTTVTYSDGSTPQNVIAREINPVTNFDTGWYETGFVNSQNSHILDTENANFTLYVYGNVIPGTNRKVSKGQYNGPKTWGTFSDTGFTSLGRTGPYTVSFQSKIYRFRAEYGPKALLQVCAPAATPSPSQSPSPSPVTSSPNAPINVSARHFECLSDGKVRILMTWTDNSLNESGFIVEARAASENNFQTVMTTAPAARADNVFVDFWREAQAGVKYIFRFGATNSLGTNYAYYNDYTPVAC